MDASNALKKIDEIIGEEDNRSLLEKYKNEDIEKLGSLFAPFNLHRQMPVAIEIGCESGEHKDCSNAEAVVPAVGLCQEAA